MRNENPLILEELVHLEKELSLFNSSDLLVRFNPSESLLFEEGDIAITPAFEQLIQQAKKKELQHGFVSLSVSEGWILGKEGTCMPLFIHSIDPRINGVRNTLKWNLSENEWLLNPHISHLVQAFNLPLETEKELIIEQLKDIGYFVNEKERFVGFFHPFRYSLLREANELKSKTDLHELDYFFDGSQAPLSEDATEIAPLLFSADQSQYEAIRFGLKNSMVVQGPPGTGKSQVLANLLGLLVQEEQRVLVCSTKRQALEVLEQRFKTHKLEDLIFLRNGEHSAKALLASLQQSWKWLENHPLKNLESNTLASVNQFNRDLACYHQSGLIGSLSPREFLRQTGLNPSDKVRFHAGLPTYDVWKKDLELLRQIPHEALNYLSQISTTLTLQQDFEGLLLLWRNTTEQLQKLSLTNHSIEEIAEHHRICQAAHLFSGDNYQRFYPLLKRKKHLFKLKDAWEKLQLTRQPLTDKLAAWRQLPTLEELKHLEMKWRSKGFWNRKKIQRQQSLWLRLDGLDWQPLIKTTYEYYEHQFLELALVEKLHVLGFNDPSTDFASFTSFTQLQESTLFQIYERLKPEEIYSLRENFFDVSRALSNLHRTLQPSENQKVFQLLLGLTANAASLVTCLKYWDQINKEAKGTLKQFNHLEAFNKAVIETEWNRFLTNYPTMVGFMETSEEHLDTLTRKMETSAHSFTAELHQKRKNTFDAYHELLAKPTRKLSEEQLRFKESLKAGKRKLVKWFSKKRSLPTVSEVLNSEANVWVHLLKPIWFTNPIQLTLDFELRNKLFDVALVDEASQMPLAHALGTLYRSKRMVVVGDLMQMAPTAYFSSGSVERLSLLEHAAYHLPSKRLKFHYRSSNEKLIAFSNKHFYQNELVVVPCYPSYQAIEDHLIEGIYKEGVNQEEIHRLIEILLSRLSAGVQSLGVITFSERQLEALYEGLRNENHLLIWEAIASGVLILKTLEQVQGDEYDEMVLSLGYGKNPNGKVDLRMGPLTQIGGEKRLNVLLTRAKIKLHVVRSIGSSAFGTVNSEGLRILKEWLYWIENLAIEPPASVGNSAFLSAQDGILVLDHIADMSTTYLNLQAYRGLLQERGWNLKEKRTCEERDHTRILPLDDSERLA